MLRDETILGGMSPEQDKKNHLFGFLFDVT